MNEEILSTMNEVSSTELDAGNAVDCTLETSDTGEITNPVVTVSLIHKNEGPSFKAVLKAAGGGFLFGVATGLGGLAVNKASRWLSKKVEKKRHEKMLKKLQEEMETETE